MIKTEKNISYKSKTLIRNNFAGWVLLIPALFLFYYMVWRPIGTGILYSFFNLTGFKPTKFVGIKNYIQVISDTNFLTTLKNTVEYVLWSLLIGMPLPLLCAVMLNEMIHGKQFIKFATFIPGIIPAVAVSLIWTNVYMEGPGGLLNMIRYFFGAGPQQWLLNKNLTIPLIIISMTWNGFGGTMLYYLAILQSVNTELYEAARIDGANFFRRFRTVELPHVMPLFLLMVIRQIIGVFQTLDAPLIMTGGGPNNASTTLALTAYYYAFKFNQADKALAVNVITFLILVGLTFVYFKAEKKLGE